MKSNTDSTIFPTTRFTLLARLNDPAARAWDEFFSVYGPVIYRMALHRGLRESDAEEVVAVVMRYFVGTVANGCFDPSRRPFRHYLRRASNNVIRRVRRDGRSALLELSLDDLASDEPLPDADWERVEREERWQACLERMRSSSVVSPRDFDAFEALVLGGEPAEKVARRFGVTTNRLYGIKHAVIRRLRQIREELDAELGEV
ncbi:MAG: hypothetical protein DCC65_07965 [Planctomycetota bacterium]|nr:MAG: hypothetical protein DCC65_07965 [Planctomycetota bacterium]